MNRLVHRRRDPRIRQLERIGTLKHWTSRVRHQRRLDLVSRCITATRNWRDEKRDDVRLLPDLIRRALFTGVGACILLVVVELFASFLSRRGVHLTRQLNEKISEPNKYESLVVAIVGAEMFLLAMFYSTMGVIASTAYQSVSGEIRQLFVQERGNRQFTRIVMRPLVLGVLVLSMGPVNYQPYSLTIVVLALLTIFSVLSLVVLGTKFFNFFDLSSLSDALPDRFSRALKAASVCSGDTFDDLHQRRAHDQAVEVIRLYRQLSTLLSERKSSEITAPLKILNQLLEISGRYGVLKSAIPTTSHWYKRIPEYRNWLTLDHSRLDMALKTRTGVNPKVVPDHLWIEREFVDRFRNLFPLIITESDWPKAIELADTTIQLIKHLAAQLEIDAALLWRAALVECLNKGITTPTPSIDGAVEVDHAAGIWWTFRDAAAERIIMSVTAIWLGFVEPVRDLSLDRLRSAWDAGVRDETAPYGIRAPRQLLIVLEEIASGIALERRTEGRRISPSWWVHHFSARAMTRDLIAGSKRIFAVVDHSVVAAIEAVPSHSDARLGTLMTFQALELVSKLDTHLPVVRKALAEMSTARNEHTGDDQWPDDTLKIETIADMERRLLRYLSKVSVVLESNPHDDSHPDLFGQAYKVLFDATFQAIIEADNSLAGDLYPNVFLGAFRARGRILNDLSNERPMQRFIFGTEPLVDLMELSGYALLLQELNGSGIWDSIRERWDTYLVGDSALRLAEHLLEILKIRESIVALTTGGLERTKRRMQLNKLLRNRGVVETDDWTSFEGDEPRPHQSAIVCAFAPGDLGVFEDPADLFLVEYLLSKPNCDGLELSRSAQSLKSQIDHKRGGAEL